MSDFERGLLDFLKREYGVSARIDQWSRHPRVIFTHNGVEREVPIPGSPSDWRSLHNMQADLRRLLGPRVKVIKRERRSLEDLDHDLKRRAMSLIEKAPPLLPQEEKMSKRAPRRYNTADIAPLEVIRQRLNVNYSQFSQMLGYASNSYTDWVRTSKCPAVAVLAAEAVLARAELPPESTTEIVKHYLLTVTPNEPPRVSPMGEVQRMTIAGRNYLLVEEA